MTFKPVEYMRHRGCFAGLMEVDSGTGELIRVLRIPAAAFRTKSSFMVPYAQALALEANTAYVGMWNYIAIVDLDDFSVVDSISYPEMSDVHSIAIDGNHIYIVCTASETLLCLDKETLEKKWVWGPGEPILSTGSVGILPMFRSRWYLAVLRRLGLNKYIRFRHVGGADTRHIHKSISPSYRHHLNNVAVHAGEIFLGTKGWFDTSRSSVIKIGPQGNNGSFFVLPGGFMGAHDAVFDKGFLYVTEADNGSIARANLYSGKINRYRLPASEYFVRGLCKVGDEWVVGFTPLRGSSRDACIGFLHGETFSVRRFIKIPQVYGTGQPVAVHSIDTFYG